MTTSSSASQPALNNAVLNNIFNSPDDVPNDIELDAILVLGGGVPISLEEPPVYVQRRCDDAIAFLRNRRRCGITNDDDQPQTQQTQTQQQQAYIPILCLSAGTAHLPQLMAEGTTGLPIWEATSSAAYFLRHYSPNDVVPEQLFVETTSYDTIGNAFFARTTHTDLHGWRRLLIITNEFHMNRTKAIFDWIFSIAPSDSRNHTSSYQLYYLTSPNVGLTEEAVEARRLREEQSLVSVTTKLAPTYTTLSQVATFLYQHHDLYTASKLVQRSALPKPTSGNDATETAAEVAAALKASYGGGAK